MVSTFSADLKAFGKEAKETVHAIYLGTVEGVTRSVIEGSPLTGSPGQPHDLQADKWSLTADGEWAAVLSTSEKSARSVEDGVSYKHGGKPLKRLKSPKGGFHSIKLTIHNGDKIVQAAAQRVLGAR